MITQLGIYTHDDKGFRRLGAFRLVDGAVIIEADDIDNRRLMEHVANSVAPYSLQRQVFPSEGELFLQGLIEEYGSKSYWRLADESNRTTSSAD